MAKDSPYFKFYVSEYNDGDIQLCSLEAQGLFTNLCSIYWSKEGELFLSKAKRLWKVREKIWTELIDEKCIKVNGDVISISFLDKQLHERNKKAITNAKNGEKGGRPKTENNPVGFINETETKANESNIEREDNKKIIKGKEEESNAREIKNFDWFKNQIDEIWIDQLPAEKKLKLGAAIENAWSFLTTDSHRLKIIDATGCKKLVNNAFGFLRNENNGKHKNTRSAEQFDEKSVYSDKF